jgi:hypothetical protein
MVGHIYQSSPKMEKTIDCKHKNHKHPRLVHHTITQQPGLRYFVTMSHF